MLIKRQPFLNILHALQPGLNPKADIVQSDCFLFMNGKAFTFNEKRCCHAVSGLEEGFTGSVPAQALVDWLEKIPDEELELEPEADKITLKTKSGNRGIGISLAVIDEKLLDAVDNIADPEVWYPLDTETFNAASLLVSTCAGKDDSRTALTCVHYHPEYLEACDNYQLLRFTLALGHPETFLLSKEDIGHIVELKAKEFALSPSWVHFRSEDGLTTSCMRYLSDLPDITNLYEVEGEDLAIPSDLGTIVKRVEVFSEKGGDYSKLMFSLEPGANGSKGTLSLTGRGAGGYAWEKMELEYTGKPLAFLITPRMLAEISQRYQHCQVSDTRLKVNGENYQYVSCLSKVKGIWAETKGE